MRYLLVLLGLLVSDMAEAIDCRENPDCALMGYSTQTDPNCLDNGYISCPFDTAYKKCVNYKCEAWGFTQSDKSSWCAEVATCPTDKNFTLCQKPCFATDYATLKDLAESGKCKVVTVRDDIEMPINQGITLAANTIIDGGNHTITSSGNKENLTIFSMNNKSGIKNIKIRHTQTETQAGFSLLKGLTNTENVSIALENTDFFVSSGDNQNHSAAVLSHGTYNISGKFALDIQMKNHMGALKNYVIGHFENAEVSIKIKGISGDMLSGINFTFVNSTINADISGYYFVNGAPVTLKNSKANLKGNLFWSALGMPQLILEESTVTLDLSYINSGSDSLSGKSAAITLKGTTDHPSVLDMRFTHAETNGRYTNIITTNLTDTFVLNGKTYRPLQVGTTKLSEIENSENWEKVTQ